MKKSINWKIFFILLSLSLLSILCVFPYVLTLQGELLRQVGQPIWLILVAQLIQSSLFFSIALFLGLFLAKKVDFRLPLLQAVVEKNDYKGVLQSILVKSVFCGVTVAVAIYVLDSIFTTLGLNITTHDTYAPAWQTILASFYGGITEEILMRLFLMTLFTWIGMKLLRDQKPRIFVILISIFLAAIIFGLGHLPVTASLTEITPLVIARAIILNGVGGIVFGWLFWKKGLESAIIAHFTTDIFLLTLLPLVFK